MITTLYVIRQKLFLRRITEMKTNKIKILIMLLFILLGITIANAQTNEKSFNIGKNGKIEINIDYGDIKIETRGDDQVTVKYDEDDDADYSSLKIVQNGNTLSITSGDYTSEDIVLFTPSSINLDLNTGGGDIMINGNISGKVACTTAGGDIHTKDITGNAAMNTAGGEVIAGKIDGDAVVNSGGGDLKIGTITGKADMNTGGGNIQLYDVNKGLKVTTGGGNVKAGNVGGVFIVTTGGGNVDVKKVTGEFKVTTGGGNVSVETAKGESNATTGGGNLTLKGLNGGVECYTGSGDIYIELIPGSKAVSKINSGNGNITLYLPESANATVLAKVRGWDTLGGDKSSPITSDFKLATENLTSNSIKSTYVINGGGSTIEVSTTSGEIHIKKMK
jgi:hypothetical protein